MRILLKDGENEDLKVLDDLNTHNVYSNCSLFVTTMEPVFEDEGKKTASFTIFCIYIFDLYYIL